MQIQLAVYCSSCFATRSSKCTKSPRDKIAWWAYRPTSFKDILESLFKNTHLRGLWLYGLVSSVCFDSNKLLCDISSIQSISNSNHTLEYITFEDRLSTLSKQCLEINKNEYKAKVIGNKIRKFYFVGEHVILHSPTCLFLSCRK